MFSRLYKAQQFRLAQSEKMKLFLGLSVCVVKGDDPADPGDDIRYSRCQQQIFARQGINIPDSHVLDTESCDDARALDDLTKKWDLNYNQSIDKFEVPYCFDGTHTASEQAFIEAKLDEFERDTCVKMVSHACPDPDNLNAWYEGKVEN